MKVETAIRLAGSVKALADLLGISHQAVYQWGETVPQLQVYRLKEMRPEWFKVEAKTT